MPSSFRKALRAHIVNTSLYEPRPRIDWLRHISNALFLALIGGVCVLIGLLH